VRRSRLRFSPFCECGRAIVAKTGLEASAKNADKPHHWTTQDTSRLKLRAIIARQANKKKSSELYR
jgi:hypothetical protein